MLNKSSRRELRSQRHRRVRKTLFGTPVRPRFSIFRSEKQIYAQLIDDIHSQTLISASSLDKEVKEQKIEAGNKPLSKPFQLAKAVGVLVAKRALEKGISAVVFDRGGFKFHGRIQALADGAREAGLKF